MLFEDLLFLIAIGATIFLIGIPLFKLVKTMIPNRRDPVVEARKRLEIAQKETEAARLNKEAEQLYQKMYQEALEDSSAIEDEELRKKK